MESAELYVWRVANQKRTAERMADVDVLILDLSSAGIEGECRLAGYEGGIELLSFSHGIAQQISGDAGTSKSGAQRNAGKPAHQKFTVTKYQDKTSPALLAAAKDGLVIPTVKLTVGQKDEGKVERTFMCMLTDAVIREMLVRGGGGGKPQETVIVDYGKIEWDYAAKAAGPGDVQSTWSLDSQSGE